MERLGRLEFTLILKVLDQSYTNWVFYGKTIHNASPTCINEEEPRNYKRIGAFEIVKMVQAAHDCFVCDLEKLNPLFREAKMSLYNGCKKFTKLSALVKLYNLKVKTWVD